MESKKYLSELRTISIIGCLLFLVSCSSGSTDTTREQHFLEKQLQQQESREIREQIQAITSYNMLEFNIYGSRIIEIENDRLFILANEPDSLLSLGLNDFSDRYWLGPGEGRGPGEMQGISSYAVLGNRIIFSHESSGKVLIYNLNGEIVNEFIINFRPHRIELLPDNRLVAMSPSVGLSAPQDNLFRVYSTEGVMQESFGQPDSDIQGFLQYEGFTHVDHSGNIYFAGYAEPILKKYSPKGDLLFSKATIDNWDTSANYSQSVDGDTRIIGFAPAALYSTVGFTVYNDYLIVRPDFNDMEELYHIVDIYDSRDGTYLYSVEFEGDFPIHFAASDQYIYTTERTDEDDYLLKVYPNFLNEETRQFKIVQ